MFEVSKMFTISVQMIPINLNISNKRFETLSMNKECIEALFVFVFMKRSFFINKLNDPYEPQPKSFKSITKFSLLQQNTIS